ncbi:XRE family transcriptional regulator [Streptomyces anulatus]|uniref:telomere-protecting terminal protein Tpg n=1 Tax=Streptomyces anulatus TaxID=1892 RepID=UPI0033CB81BB
MARTIRPHGAADDDALIAEALERADRKEFTTEPPRTLQGQINYLLRKLGSARAVAAELGVTADSVNRYRRGARKNPPKHVADRIKDAVRSRWQPRVRQRARRRAAATTGVTVEFRAQFGYRAPVGTTDEMRLRLLTLHLPPEYATRLFDAQAGASGENPNEVLAEAAQTLYFQTDSETGGARAQDLEVEITNIDYIAARY